MIAVECHADEKLVRFLGVPDRDIRHTGGRGKVLEKLKKESSGTGMVDEDPNSAKPGEFRCYRREKEVEGICLLRHRDWPDKNLIMLCPRLEEWLYSRAKAARIHPVDFGLPNNARDLHRIGRYERRSGFEKFLRKLREHDNALKQLETWLQQPTGSS